MWANVGMFHEGVCALAAGIATSETAKVSIRNKAIDANILLEIFVFFSLLIFYFEPYAVFS
jgi:hypothetical protein